MYFSISSIVMMVCAFGCLGASLVTSIIGLIKSGKYGNGKVYAISGIMLSGIMFVSCVMFVASSLF